MFHIVAGVQVVPDVLVLFLNREYVISDFTDYQYDMSYPVLDNLLNTPNVTIARASSYDQLVGTDKQFADDLAFFKDVYVHSIEKPTVYASVQDYAIIVAKTLKLIYPNLSADTAQLLYKLSIDKFTIKYAYLDSISRGDHLISPKRLREIGVKHLQKEQFIDLYNQTTFTGDQEQVESFRQSIINEVSSEFHIANSLYGNDKFDKVLLRQLKNVAIDHVRSFCHEYSEIEAFNVVSNGNYDQDIQTLTANSQALQTYMNPKLLETTKLDEFEEYAKLARAAVEYYQQRIGTYHWDLEPRVVDNWSGEFTDFMWLCEILDDDFSVKQILERELAVREKGYAGSMLYFYSAKDNINPMILFYVYDLYKQDKQLLQQFVL